jgi:hypothetical protein
MHQHKTGERFLIAGAGAFNQLVFRYRGARRQSVNPIPRVGARRCDATPAARH